MPVVEGKSLKINDKLRKKYLHIFTLFGYPTVFCVTSTINYFRPREVCKIFWDTM